MRPETEQILAEKGIVGRDAETAVAWMRSCLEEGAPHLINDAMTRAFGHDSVRAALVILHWATEDPSA